jgi:class 3 adenylate cyclase/tetratricopeptide (TPR) repeat protein
MSGQYEPDPIQTAGVSLSEELLSLVELLAKNAHDRWAQQRLADGWRYGPKRDDERKEHPCLVPYESLPDSEKTYDRTMALETLRVVVALGYVLQPPGTSAKSRGVASEASDEREGVLPPEGLAALWTGDETDASVEDVYQHVGERALQLGKPLLAYDVLEKALKVRPSSRRLRQLQALALLRGGATERANAILAQIDREFAADEETLGLLARSYKDMAARALDAATRRAHLTRAYDAYVRAYDLTRGHWTGINAATLAFVIGREDKAIALARGVHEQCLRELESTTEQSDGRYWVLATLGEASLILRQWSDAEEWYGRAAKAGRGRLGDLSSTRRNAHLLFARLDVDPAPIERLLRLPRVAVFTGHMIDVPGRRSARFPPELEADVRQAIRERIERRDIRLGFAAGACGSDLLFCEALLDVTGELNVVLPYGRERFLKDSVERVSGWTQRFERVLERATQVVTASPEKLEGASASYDYASRLLLGLAAIRAEQLGTELVPLAVWDGMPGEPGGTATIVEEWQRRGHAVEVIDLRDIRHRRLPDVAIETPASSPARAPSDSPDAPRIMAILFADAVHFSKLTESQVPRFVEHFLGAVAALIARTPNGPVTKNTWGDGLYFVFSGIEEAGEFALALSELVSGTDWQSKGLPASLNLRVALHAGPVYPCRDPVTGQVNYIGSHVSRGARIEPITPPGHVYASQGFAALAAATNVRGFVCEYAGQTLWAKGYGTFPTYHVRRRDAEKPVG